MSAIVFDNPITSTPGPQRSSLRQSLLRKTITRDEACNDDDAERSSLVASERVVSSTPSSTGTGRDQSISLTPQKEHYQGCLKLYAENKITKDNAWSLQLIDFMTAMLRRHDQRMENLATASTVVDASTRIYSFRVDAVHHDVLLMAGGLTKVAHTKRGKKDDDNAEDDGAGDQHAPPLAAKKKKRMKGATAPNPDVFNGDFETNLCIDPFFERLAATAGDVTSSNRAFNAALPVHDGSLALVLRTDIAFLPAAGAEAEGGAPGPARLALPARLLPPFTPLEHICRPFTGFSISDWDPDSEERQRAEGEARLDLSQQAVAFDADAPVEPAPGAEPADDLYEEEPLGGIESEEEGDVAVAACVARAAPAAPARLADMRPAAPRDSRLEYSYCALLAAWAGPRHWRLKHNRASKVSERTQSSAGGEAQAARRVRARRPLEFLGAGLAADWRAPAPDYEPAPPARVMISRKTLATGPAWSERNYRTPVDRGLDESFFRKLFLRRSVLLGRARGSSPDAEPEQLPAEAARDYDYDNENDASYCVFNAQDGSTWAGEEARAAGDVLARPQPPPLADDFGDMIEPPTKIAKIFIPYAMRAKKVDMKQLKQVTWRLLTAGGEGAVRDSSFRSVLAGLAAALGAEARASLSAPLALLAVLHLANERGLVLETREDLADIHISGLHQ